MLFSSPEFLFLFFPLALAGFLAVRKLGSLRLIIGILVAVSLGLYFYSEPSFVPVMLVSVIANFWVGRGLRAVGDTHAGRSLFALGICLNLAPFLFFKYVASAAPSSSAIANWAATTLPLGISFFTFQQIAYLLDVRKGTVPPVSFGKYCLFVLFFPHLVAGPIVRHNELIGQFDLKIFSQDLRTQWAAAIALFGVGLFKKIIVADHLAKFVEPGLRHVDAGMDPGFVEAWSLLLSAAAQIYYDYSAYADMALALALCFGLHLPISFQSPYQALSISEFWRRWNITLMRFFRDHIYIPLGGSRHGLLRQIAAIFATMIACGIWHGAGGNFVAWGAFVATLLAIELALRNRSPGSETAQLSRRVMARTIVLLAYVCPLAFFLFPDTGRAVSALAGLVGAHGFNLPAWLLPDSNEAPAPLMPGRLQAGLLVGAWAGIYLMPNTYQMFRSALSSEWTDAAVPVMSTHDPRFSWRPSIVWAFVTAACLVLGLTSLGSGTAKAFYYFRF